MNRQDFLNIVDTAGKSYTISSVVDLAGEGNIVLPDNITLSFSFGRGYFTNSGSSPVTIVGSGTKIEAGLWKIFDITGGGV